MKYQYFTHNVFGRSVVYRFKPNEIYGGYIDNTVTKWTTAERSSCNCERNGWNRISRDTARNRFPHGFR